MRSLTVPVLAFSLLFAGCTTTVINEEDRTVPEDSQNFDDRMEDDSMDSESMSSVIKADLSQSFLAFTGTRQVPPASHEGAFRDFDFMLELDPSDPDDLTKATITVDINVDSIETDAPGATRHLKSEDFFDVANYPTAQFVSTSIEQEDDQTFTITGDLTLHGMTAEETFEATITDSFLTMETVLDRTVYGVGSDDIVDIPVPFEAKIVFE